MGRCQFSTIGHHIGIHYFLLYVMPLVMTAIPPFPLPRATTVCPAAYETGFYDDLLVYHGVPCTHTTSSCLLCIITYRQHTDTDTSRLVRPVKHRRRAKTTDQVRLANVIECQQGESLLLGRARLPRKSRLYL